MGIWVGTPGLTVGFYIWKSLIPALIGNLVGGGFFVGVMYWYLYLAGNSKPVQIDGETFEHAYGPPVTDGHSPVGGSSSMEQEQSHRKNAENMV